MPKAEETTNLILYIYIYNETIYFYRCLVYPPVGWAYPAQRSILGRRGGFLVKVSNRVKNVKIGELLGCCPCWSNVRVR